MFRFVAHLCLLLPVLTLGAIVSSPATGNESVHSERIQENVSMAPVLPGPAGSAESTKAFSSCLSRDALEIVDCWGVKSIALLDRASRMDIIELLPGVTLKAADSSENEIQQRSARALLTEEQIENSIASVPEDRSSKILDMLLDSVAKFLQTYSIQFKVPEEAAYNMQRAIKASRTGLRKKLFSRLGGFMPFFGVFALKFVALLPLIVTAIGFLTLKAVVVAKLAFAIAAFLAMQRYTASRGGPVVPAFGGLGGASAGVNDIAYPSASSSYNSYSNYPGPGSSYNSYSAPLPSAPTGGYFRRVVSPSESQDSVAAASQQIAYGAQIPQHSASSSYSAAA